MYLWIALDVENSLKELKDEVKRIEKLVDFNDSKLTLPIHISLRISFEIAKEKVDECTKDIRLFLKEIKSFKVEADRIELHETISWLKMKNNEYLDTIHESLCQMLQEKYNIPLYEYDKDFVFHSTLFLDNDTTKVKEAFLKIKDFGFNKDLEINKALIGSSLSGAIGTYNVIEEIKL